MATTPTEQRGEVIDGIRYLSRQETIDFFDEQARARLGMSGEEFLRRLDAGEYNDILDDPVNHSAVVYLGALSRSVR